MEKWIITAASSNLYDNLLTSFIASLRENAGWEGNIGVMNYGLTPHQVWTLGNNDVTVIAPAMKYRALIDDRFTTIAKHFRTKPPMLIAEWDVDIWFCREVSSVFRLIEANTLLCTYDATLQAFMGGCVQGTSQAVVQKHVDIVTNEIGHVLQGGFIAGDTNAWDHFSGYQDTLIDLKVCHDAFGVDMVALNLFKHFWSSRVKVVGVEWNCLPEWVISRKGDQFFCRETEEPLRAIHVSSPNRKEQYMYKTYFPEQFDKWLKLLT